MNKSRLFVITLIVILPLALVFSALAGGALAAGSGKSLRSQSDPLATLFPPDGGLPAPFSGDGPWVVRAYFSNPDMVAPLSQRFEPWEVHPDKGYLVLEVGPEDVRWLLDQGFELELDAERTRLINQPPVALPGQVSGIPGYPCYRTVEETYDTAASIVAAHPTLAAWIDVGDSWEKTALGGLPGYDMRVLKLTNSLVPGPKPVLLITASIHAREYAPAELATRFAELLINNYNIDADITWLLDYNEIHLMLQANPDGRKQAETGILWRKNTDNNYCTDTNSRGADLNRNFEFYWGCCGGSSSSQCNETYRGPSAASEPEVQAIQAYMRQIFPDQRQDPLPSPAPDDATGVFIDLHSYSQLVLWPWGFTSNTPPNSSALQTLGRRFAYYNNYWPEQSIGLYPTDGTTDDFAYGDLGVAAYTFEMGTNFFQDCGTFENIIVPDNLGALLYAAKSARTPYLTPSGPDTLNLAALPSGVTVGDLIQLTASIDDQHFNQSNGTEPTQNIIAAAYYIDIPPWSTNPAPVAYAMAAADGSFNSKQEDVIANVGTTTLSAGRHILYVRGQDASGAWGPVSASFVYVLDPAVSPHIDGFVRDSGSNQPLQATVQAGDFLAETDPASGYFSMLVISGTYDLQASGAGHVPATNSGVSVANYQTSRQNFYLDPLCTIFSDTVESGNIGWTATLPWAITGETSHSPTHSWTDSPGGNYANNRNISLISPVFDLSNFNGVTLNFWHIYDLENGFDYAYVETSTDGGASWSTVATYSGIGHKTWTDVSLPLPGLDGKPNARIRFRFTSDGSQVYDGWHIDDIFLNGGGTGCYTPQAPAAGFISSSPVPLGQPVLFSDTTVGTPPFIYHWDFGDNAGASSLSDPTYTYITTGTFTVTLTVSNTLGIDTVQHNVSIQEPLPVSSVFMAALYTGPIHTGEQIPFSANIFPAAAYKPYTYTVDFHDGTSPLSGASSANPLNLTHVYPLTGTFNAEISVWNIYNTSPVTASVPVTITTRSSLDLAVDQPLQSGIPGQTITYTLQITNTGSLSDKYDVVVVGGWISTTMVVGPLAPGQHDSLALVAVIPENAAYGDTDNALLSVTSRTQPATQREVSLTTRAIWQRLYLPLVLEP